jgi:transposase
MPPRIRDWLPEDHPAQFVVEIVDQLDIGVIERQYARRGGPAYSPRILLALLFYGYSDGIFSSRKLEKATRDRIDYRFIACDRQPDHDTINEFRKRFLKDLQPLFTQILLLAREAGALKLGNVAVDGTKVKANASKHCAVSYRRAGELEKLLEAEVAALLAKAAEAEHDATPLEDEGVHLPAELDRREKRLEKIKQAKAAIEERARERYEREKADCEAKLAERKRKEEESGRKPRGHDPKPPDATPRDKDQYNFTDPESRIMKESSSGGFAQAYNAQAAVDTETMLIVGQSVSNHTNDHRELVPTLDAITEEVGKPESVVADAGYSSQDNVERCEERGIDPYLAPGRMPHHRPLEERLDELRGIEPPNLPPDATAQEKMRHKLRTLKGRARYRLRKMTVEPVFGIVKEVLGFRRFLLRGLEKVRGEWTLVCIGFNLKRLRALWGGE